MSIFSARTLPSEVELPATGRWEIDPSHTVVGFTAVHLGFAKVRGEFRSFSGTAMVAENPSESRVEVEIDASSIDTREPNRDRHLRSQDFLDAANHPKMTFSSTRIRGGGRRWQVEGDLTIRGITRSVVLDVEFAGVVTDEDGTPKAILSARAEFDRREYGLTWNQIVEAGRLLVGNRVAVELDIELRPA